MSDPRLTRLVAGVADAGGAEDVWFDLAGEVIKTFKPEILEELKKENQLRTDYSKLLASAKIMFEGEERNLSGLTPFMESPDRDMRKRASEARWKFVEDNSEEFDRLYDELVKVRHSIALKLSYENFIPVGYARMRRTDYNANMVASIRLKVIFEEMPESFVRTAVTK